MSTDSAPAPASADSASADAVPPVEGTLAKPPQSGGRKNPWLAHVKATMRGHRNKSFKQVLKIAKKTYRKKSRSRRQSQSQSQNGGKKRRQVKKGGSKKQQQQQQLQEEQQQQQGGSGVGGGKEGMAAFGENAAPVS
jgi:hypothetical protein